MDPQFVFGFMFLTLIGIGIFQAGRNLGYDRGLADGYDAGYEEAADDHLRRLTDVLP